MLFLIAICGEIGTTLEKPGHYTYKGNSSSVYNFDFTNSSLSAQFLFQTDKPENVMIKSANVVLTKPFFLYENTGRVSLSLENDMDFSVWLFPQNLCDSRVSVFGAASNSRFRVRYSTSVEKHCFFTINHQFDVSFINFMRPMPEGSKLALHGYTNETIVLEKSWYDGNDEMPRMKTDLPLFFSFTRAIDDAEWALNINFTTIDPILNNTCLFEETLVFDGVSLNETLDMKLEHVSTCKIAPAPLMWLYVTYSIFTVVIISIAVFVGFCSYRDWKREHCQTEESVISSYSPLRSVSDLESGHYSGLMNSPSSLY